jgi:hypothetical protein
VTDSDSEMGLLGGEPYDPNRIHARRFGRGKEVGHPVSVFVATCWIVLIRHLPNVHKHFFVWIRQQKLVLSIGALLDSLLIICHCRAQFGLESSRTRINVKLEGYIRDLL